MRYILKCRSTAANLLRHYVEWTSDCRSVSEHRCSSPVLPKPFNLSTSHFFSIFCISKFERNSWHIFYMNLSWMQSSYESKDIDFILETWSMRQGAVPNFQVFLQAFTALIRYLCLYSHRHSSHHQEHRYKSICSMEYLPTTFTYICFVFD